MERQTKILLIDFCDFEDYPIGGYLSFAKNLMKSFGNELALVGISTKASDPVGEWFKKEINGLIYDFFALARYNKSKTKHFFPDRLICYMLLKRYKKAIFKIGIQNIFIRRQEIILSLSSMDLKTINSCYCFAGLENPLNISKYWYAKLVANLFEKFFFKKLNQVNTILASGDENAINEMIKRSRGKINREDITQFPTRIDTNIFKPLNKLNVRKKLNLPEDKVIVITTGRLASIKGWKFMIDCYVLFEKKIPNTQFYFIGEGEDFNKIQDYIVLKDLTENVILAGKKKLEEIAQYLNASDLFIMGSYKEGWSTSLSEAIACGISACVTNFSSAIEIVQEGQNGFVIIDHNINKFVNGMINAYKLPVPIYNDNVKNYSTAKLKEDIIKVWNLL